MLSILELIDNLPAGLFRAVDTLGDRLVAKASQLISNKTTNICENFMSISCKMDGGKYFNRVQSGSFHHRCMAAALRVQCGPNWIAHVWKTLFHSVGETLNTGCNRRKRKLTLDNARKVLLKYKKRRLMRKSKHLRDDASYGTNPVEQDISSDDLKRLCNEYLARLTVNEQQQQSIAIRTTAQANDPSGEWQRQRHGRLTTSHFGEICKRRANYAPLTIRILYKQKRETPAMRYGILHEKIARDKYAKYLKANCHPEASVAITGLHIDLKVYTLINTYYDNIMYAHCFIGLLARSIT